MDAEVVSKLIKNAKDAMIIAVITITILVGVLKKDDIALAVVDLTNRMQTAEIAGVKISFGENAYKLNPDLAHVSADQKLGIRGVLDKLASEEIERLLHRTEYGESQLSPDDLNCDYEKANSTMRMYAAADEALFEKNLFQRITKPEFTSGKRDRLPPEVSAKLGAPSGCYQVVLTPLGMNVKSVLVTELSRAFSRSSLWASTESAPQKPAEHRPPKKN
jgi:hypothetical protein